jgi:hypothetical protein
METTRNSAQRTVLPPSRCWLRPMARARGAKGTALGRGGGRAAAAADAADAAEGDDGDDGGSGGSGGSCGSCGSGNRARPTAVEPPDDRRDAALGAGAATRGGKGNTQTRQTPPTHTHKRSRTTPRQASDGRAAEGSTSHRAQKMLRHKRQRLHAQPGSSLTAAPRRGERSRCGGCGAGCAGPDRRCCCCCCSYRRYCCCRCCWCCCCCSPRDLQSCLATAQSAAALLRLR